MGAVEHDGGEPGLDAGLGALIGAVVQVQGHRHGDAQGLIHGADHGGNGLEAGHILAGTLGNAQNDGALHGLRLKQDALGPLQVVDVELADTIMAIAGLQEHIGCIDEHNRYLLNFTIKQVGIHLTQSYYRPALTKRQQKDWFQLSKNLRNAGADGRNGNFHEKHRKKPAKSPVGVFARCMV